MAGKGDKPRKGADIRRYRKNYSDIKWSRKDAASMLITSLSAKVTLEEKEKKHAN